MPAAAWAARSGDPVLFVERDSVPEPTAEALRRNPSVPVYVLGPESAVSDRRSKQIDKLGPGAEARRRRGPGGERDRLRALRRRRASAGTSTTPATGWWWPTRRARSTVRSPRPLSASGTWGPLLVTDDPAAVSPQLRGYLLDLKPGYEDDPTRALYNHVWLIGDTRRSRSPSRPQLDELAELAQIGSGSGEPEPAAPGQAGAGADD